MNPKVLITGHPNSGTSFLAELVVNMGFSPGDRALLKPPDGHNPHGYWEHMPLQNHVRALSGYGDWMHITGAYPPEPLGFTAKEKRRTASLFEGAGVEVFKETGLPVMYQLFPPDSKYLIITRRRRAMYESQGSDYQERGISFDRFGYNVETYKHLLAHLVIDRDPLFCFYESFQDHFDTQVLDIAKFLDVEPDIPRLCEIWRPRR